VGIGSHYLGLVWQSQPGFVFCWITPNLLFSRSRHRSLVCSANGWSRMVAPWAACIPVVLAVSFWRKGQPFPFAAALIWFFENWAEHCALHGGCAGVQLPLVGGGDHDWNTIFSRWRLLAYDTQIAAS